MILSLLLPYWWLGLCYDSSRPILEQALPPYHANDLIQAQSLNYSCIATFSYAMHL